MTNGISKCWDGRWDENAASRTGRLLGRKTRKPLSGEAFRQKISGTDAGTRPCPVPTYTYRWDGGTARRIHDEQECNITDHAFTIGDLVSEPRRIIVTGGFLR